LTNEKITFKPVPGSRELTTASFGAAADLERLEKARPGETVEIKYNGVTLRNGRVFSSISDLYDTLMPGLDASEQAVFGHIYRLSVGEGRNWLRIGKKELMRRTRLSQRKLLKTLSSLTERNLIRPLQRNTNGTLYEVYTIEKIQSVALPKHPPEIKEKHPAKTKKVIPQREKPLESPLNIEVFSGEGKVVKIGEIAREFYTLTGKKASDVDMDLAISQITNLLEDGFTREEVRKTVKFLVDTFGNKAEISKLPYYIHQVIEEKG